MVVRQLFHWKRKYNHPQCTMYISNWFFLWNVQTHNDSCTFHNVWRFTVICIANMIVLSIKIAKFVSLPIVTSLRFLYRSIYNAIYWSVSSFFPCPIYNEIWQSTTVIRWPADIISFVSLAARKILSLALSSYALCSTLFYYCISSLLLVAAYLYNKEKI